MATNRQLKRSFSEALDSDSSNDSVTTAMDTELNSESATPAIESPVYYESTTTAMSSAGNHESPITPMDSEETSKSTTRSKESEETSKSTTRSMDSEVRNQPVFKSMEMAMNNEIVLEKIFSHLPYFDRRLHIERVCKNWKRIATKPSVQRLGTFTWKDLPFLMDMPKLPLCRWLAMNSRSLHHNLRRANVELKPVTDFSTDEAVVREVMRLILEATSNDYVRSVPEFFAEPLMFEGEPYSIFNSISIEYTSLNEFVLFQDFSLLTMLKIHFPMIENFEHTKKFQRSCWLLKLRVYEKLITKVADDLLHLKTFHVAGAEITNHALTTFKTRIMPRLYFFSLILDYLELSDVIYVLRQNNVTEIVEYVAMDFNHRPLNYHKAGLEWCGSINEIGGRRKKELHKYTVRVMTPMEECSIFKNLKCELRNIVALSLKCTPGNNEDELLEIVNSFRFLQTLTLKNIASFSFIALNKIWKVCRCLREMKLRNVCFEFEDISMEDIPPTLVFMSLFFCANIEYQHIEYMRHCCPGVKIKYFTLGTPMV